MKAYKLAEVDLPSVIDAWIETKKTIIVLATNVAGKVRELEARAREACGQGFWGVNFKSPDGRYRLYASKDEVTLDVGSSFIHLDPQKANEYWPVSLQRANEIARWLSSISENEIEDVVSARIAEG